MCDEFNIDVTDEIGVEEISEFDESVDVETEEISDLMGEMEYMEIDIDNMSLDELRDLRAELISSEVDDEMKDLTIDVETDYSYHWDGGPTHNVEWDDIADESPDVKELVLKR